jgi:alkylation response protein AidB-like acyl-CoA dehydrogenase
MHHTNVSWQKISGALQRPIQIPEYGGSGWSASKTLDAFIYAGRHDLNCRDVVGGAHVRLLLKSSHPKVLDIVRLVARGDAYMAITMTEPHAGSDFHAIKSTARKVEGGSCSTVAMMDIVSGAGSGTAVDGALAEGSAAPLPVIRPKFVRHRM